MAKLVIVTHLYDVFARQLPADGTIVSSYLLSDVLRHLTVLGHSWVVTRGIMTVEADAALLHVDATRVGDEYLALARHYGRTINFGTNDISKRKVSSLLLEKGDGWDGRVVVKSNLNCAGAPEWRHNAGARQSGLPLPYPALRRGGPYVVLDRISDVGDEIWADDDLVVERFIPEVDEDGGYALRTWIFMGERERCTRTVNRDWIVKAAGAIKTEPVEVPAELRAERERLKFDFGKFDFVMSEGKPILLDANRTPGTANALETLIRAGSRNLAEGLHGLLTDN